MSQPNDQNHSAAALNLWKSSILKSIHWHWLNGGTDKHSWGGKKFHSVFFSWTTVTHDGGLQRKKKYASSIDSVVYVMWAQDEKKKFDLKA